MSTFLTAHLPPPKLPFVFLQPEIGRGLIHHIHAHTLNQVKGQRCIECYSYWKGWREDGNLNDTRTRDELKTTWPHLLLIARLEISINIEVKASHLSAAAASDQFKLAPPDSISCIIKYNILFIMWLWWIFVGYYIVFYILSYMHCVIPVILCCKLNQINSHFKYKAAVESSLNVPDVRLITVFIPYPSNDELWAAPSRPEESATN